MVSCLNACVAIGLDGINLHLYVILHAIYVYVVYIMASYIAIDYI